MPLGQYQPQRQNTLAHVEALLSAMKEASDQINSHAESTLAAIEEAQSLIEESR